MSQQLQVTRTVDVSPERLFAVLSDPNKHTDIDGSSMLRGVHGASGRITKVGDEFMVNMNNSALGDYQMLNTVVAFESNRVIGWAPSLYPPDGYRDKLGDIKAEGHTYTWTLEPVGDSQTRVTQTYDWSNVTDPGFRKLLPLLNEEQLAQSIAKAGQLAG